MALDVGAALREGIDRGTERNALLLLVLVAVLSIASTVFSQTATAWALDVLADLAREQGRSPPPSDAFGPTPLATGIPGPLAVILFVATAVLNTAVVVVAIRTFVSEATRTVPREFLTRRIGWVTLNVLVGRLIALVLIGLGLVLLVVPGIFVAVSLFFFEQEIALNDENLVTAMEESWSLVRGDRVAVFALGAVLFGAALATSVVVALARPLVPPAAATILGVLVSAVVTVLSIAVASRAYVHLTEAEPPADAAADDEVGALGPDEIDEEF